MHVQRMGFYPTGFGAGRFSLLLGFWVLCVRLFAQVPAYYDPVDLDLRGQALATQLSSLISETHVRQTLYTPGAWDALKVGDLAPEKPFFVLLIYGFNDADQVLNNDRTRHVDSSCHVSSCTGLWVREHVYPRSLGSPNLGLEGAGSDLHALHAVDDQRNNTRGNRPFGFGSGNSAVTGNGNFYPGDEWKGDVARMIMYMHLRYPTQCPADRVGEGSSQFSDFDTMRDIFLIWNSQDPPSEHELNRNDLFYELQGNRNPFIDNPYLATQIWNGPVALDTWSSTSTTTEHADKVSVFPNPVSERLYIPGEEGVTYSIQSLFGQNMRSGLTQREGIDVASLTPGNYFICLYPRTGAPIISPFIKN